MTLSSLNGSINVSSATGRPNFWSSSVVRGRQGIKNLAQLIATLREHDFPFQEHAAVLYEIQAVLTEIRGIKEEINKLDSLLEIFTDDEYKKRARKLLNQRIETLLGRLQQIADDDL